MQPYSKHLYNGDVREANICSLFYSFKLSKESNACLRWKAEMKMKHEQAHASSKKKGKKFAYSLYTVHWERCDLGWSFASFTYSASVDFSL